MNHALRCALLLAALGVALAAPSAPAAEGPNACATASLVNPEAATGGMGGTGTVANQGSGGMGGTGAVANEPAGGMGGTGTTARDATGGMGGTGTLANASQLTPGSGGMGGTGIVGIITGFASICVGGVEVHYDPGTPVSINGQPGSTRALATGQLVVVRARAVGQQLRASGIGAIDAVNGVVTGVDRAARAIQVLGQTVRVDNARGQDINTINPGASIRVSGLRAANGVIEASRIDAAPAGAQSSLLGIVSRVDGNTAVVNGTRVALPARVSGEPLAAGAEVFVSGDWKGNELQARRVESQPVRRAIGGAERAILEGIVTGRQGRDIRIGSVAVRVSGDTRTSGGNARDTDVGRRVRVDVRRSGDGWSAERITLSRERDDGRRGGSGSSGSSPDSPNSGPGSGKDDSDNSGRSGRGGNSGSSESSGSGSSNSDRSGSGSGGERSGEERSGEDRSGGERSGGERSGGERSGGERSGGERSGGDRSGGGRSDSSGRGSGGSGRR